MTWKIEAITGEFLGQQISIERDMLVGRHQDSDIVLQSGEISRKHAALLLKDQALWVQDLNSSNGTFVNDVRLDGETQLNSGDTLQFASLKFAVLALQADDLVDESAVEAAAATEQVEVPQTVAQQMNDQGMPDLAERDKNIQLDRNGMPQNVSVPKPAPIPEGVDLNAVTEVQSDVYEKPESRVEQEKEQQKNASVGLISMIVLIILAVIGWLVFK